MHVFVRQLPRIATQADGYPHQAVPRHVGHPGGPRAFQALGGLSLADMAQR